VLRQDHLPYMWRLSCTYNKPNDFKHPFSWLGWGDVGRGNPQSHGNE